MACRNCDTEFGESDMTVLVGITQDYDNFATDPIYWEIPWHAGYGMTGECVLMQVLHFCKTNFGQHPKEIESVNILWDDPSRPRADAGVQEGYRYDDEQFLRWLVTGDLIIFCGLCMYFNMRFEYPPQLNMESHEEEPLCTAGGKVCHWCLKEKTEVSQGNVDRPLQISTNSVEYTGEW